MQNLEKKIAYASKIKIYIFYTIRKRETNKNNNKTNPYFIRKRNVFFSFANRQYRKQL